MKPVTLFIAGLAAALLTGCASVSESVGTGFGLFGKDAPAPRELSPIATSVRVGTAWSRNVGVAEGHVFTPAVMNGSVYLAGGDGRVRRIDAEGGNTVWEVSLPVELAGGVGAGDGLVVVTGSEGEVLALDADDGSLRWQVTAGGLVAVPASVSAGRVVLHPADGRVLALDASDGAGVWEYQRRQPSLLLHAHGGLTVDRGAVFAGFGGGWVVAIDLASGAPAWEEAIALPRGATDVERLADVAADPVLDGDDLFAVAYQGRLARLRATSGQMIWSRDFSSYHGLGLDEAQVYVSGADGVIEAFARDNGASVWRQPALETRQPTAPVVLSGFLVVADVQGFVHVLDPRDGSLVGRLPGGGAAVRSPLVTVSDRLAVVQDDAGQVRAIGLSRP